MIKNQNLGFEVKKTASNRYRPARIARIVGQSVLEVRENGVRIAIWHSTKGGFVAVSSLEQKIQTLENPLWNRIVGLFNGEEKAAERWFNAPLKRYWGLTPNQLSSTEDGAKEVEAIIDRFEQGIF